MAEPTVDSILEGIKGELDTFTTSLHGPSKMSFPHFSANPAEMWWAELTNSPGDIRQLHIRQQLWTTNTEDVFAILP